MQIVFPKRLSRIIVNIFFAYLTICTISLGVIASHRSRRWLISDWLINYEGGFVRRGFAGEMSFLLGRITHIRPEFLAVTLYVSLFVVFLVAARALILASSMNMWILGILLNPAIFSFQILHPNAGFRKEVILFAALALLLVLLQRRKLSSLFVSSYIAICLVFGILSHEAIAFYVPYFFAVLLLTDRTPSQACREFILPAVASLVAFYFCATHLGTEATALKICSSLGYRYDANGGLEICAGGAIPYLAMSRDFARAETFRLIRQYHFLERFPVFALLALLPVIGESLSLVHCGIKRKVGIIWALAAVSFLGSIALFLYGIDWGRWIYIHLCCLSLLLIFLDGEQSSSRAHAPQVQSSKTVHQFVCAMVLFLYATCWLLPNTVEPVHFGYVERLGRLLHVWPKTTVDDLDPIPAA